MILCFFAFAFPSALCKSGRVWCGVCIVILLHCCSFVLLSSVLLCECVGMVVCFCPFVCLFVSLFACLFVSACFVVWCRAFFAFLDFFDFWCLSSVAHASVRHRVYGTWV